MHLLDRRQARRAVVCPQTWGWGGELEEADHRKLLPLYARPDMEWDFDLNQRRSREGQSKVKGVIDYYRKGTQW